MWQAWMHIIVGFWVFLSGFWEELVVPANFVIMGVTLTVLGFWTPRNQWQGIVNGVLGLWLILSGFIPGLLSSANLLITGLIVIILAAWQAAASRQTPRPIP